MRARRPTWHAPQCSLWLDTDIGLALWYNLQSLRCAADLVSGDKARLAQISINEPEMPSIAAPWSARDDARLSLVGAPLISLRVHISPVIWRIGPAWVVLAAAWHGRPAAWNSVFLLQLATAVILADSIWGAFWNVLRFDPDAAPMTGREQQAPIRLPYATPRAPAARLARWLSDEAQPGHALQGWPLALMLSGLLALSLGRSALMLTVAVILVSLLGLAWVRRGHPAPASLQALTMVTIPWLLGQSLVGPMTTLTWPLVSGFTVLVWGLVRSAQHTPAAWLVPCGLVLVVGALIAQGAPVAAGLTGLAASIPFWFGLGRPAALRADDWAQIHPWLLITLAVAAAG